MLVSHIFAQSQWLAALALFFSIMVPELWVSGLSTAAADLRQWIPRMRVDKTHGGNLEQLAAGHRVIVVMTTIPPRIHRIEPVIDAMLAQTWPVEKLYLSIPYKYNRTGERYTIPAWLRAKRGLSIVRCQDLGPGTHLLNGLRLERDPWAWMVVVDDDHIYSVDLVENLLRTAIAHPGTAVAAQGFLSIPGLEIEKDSPRYLHDQGFAAGPVLVSYLGVVYQRGFFDDSVFDYSRGATQCKYQDDMWFSAHLARKGIRRVVLGGALGVQELKDMHLGPESLTYWEDNKPREISAECNDALFTQHNGIWTFRRRIVFALAGLPPLVLQKSQAEAQALHHPLGRGDPSVSSDALVGAEKWRDALGSVTRLPIKPDLLYLCTEASGPHVRSVSRSSTNGATFWLDGLLVTNSDACKAYTVESRISDMLRDPLDWEGDPNTVIVLGLPSDFGEREGADLDQVIDCAAQHYIEDEDDPYRIGRSSTRSDSPFCRVGKLTAVCVGAMEAFHTR